MKETIYHSITALSSQYEDLHSLLMDPQLTEALHYYQLFQTYLSMVPLPLFYLIGQKKELVSIQSVLPLLTSLPSLDFGFEEFHQNMDSFILSANKEEYYHASELVFFSAEHTFCRHVFFSFLLWTRLIEDPSQRSTLLQECQLLLGFFKERGNQYMDNKVYNSTDVHQKQLLSIECFFGMIWQMTFKTLIQRRFRRLFSTLLH